MRIENTCDFLWSLPCSPVIYGDWVFADAQRTDLRADAAKVTLVVI